MSSTPSLLVRALACGAALLVAAGPMPGQPLPRTEMSGDEEGLIDTSSLATGPFSEMSALLERTIFQVDVLTLTVRISPATATSLQEILRGAEYSDALADSAASILLKERDAWARLRFKRDVSLDQLVDGIADNMEKAVTAGLLEAADFERITSNLPIWFSFLEEGGAGSGDEIVYRILGDELRTVYRRADGSVLLDQVDVGASGRMAVLGSYFAPDSDFRKELIKSLLRQAGQTG